MSEDGESGKAIFAGSTLAWALVGEAWTGEISEKGSFNSGISNLETTLDCPTHEKF